METSDRSTRTWPAIQVSLSRKITLKIDNPGSIDVMPEKSDVTARRVHAERFGDLAVAGAFRKAMAA